MTPSQTLETQPSAVKGRMRWGRTARQNETLGEDSGYVPYVGGGEDFQTCVNAY